MLSRIFQGLFLSYGSQFYSIFSEHTIKRYGKVIRVKNQYYIPKRINHLVSFDCLVLFNKYFFSGKALYDLLIVSNIRKYKSEIQNFKFEIEITRICHPALESKVLSQFSTYMTTIYKFNHIIYRIRETMVYDILRTKRRDPDPELKSTDQI